MNNMTKLAFHEGNALVNHIADTYKTIGQVILEHIQNSLDAKASSITVIIKYHQLSKERIIYVRDNGNGISQEKFANALSRICSSSKTEDELGRFGIGLVSALGKCDEFTVTSSLKGGGSNNSYSQWTFNTEKLKAQRNIDGIPTKSLNNYLYVASPNIKAPGKTAVNWRTEIAIKNFTKDKVLSQVNLSELRSQILDRYNQKMKLNDAEINLILFSYDGSKSEMTFKAGSFNGTKLAPITYDHPICGKTIFTMYLSPKTSRGRLGKVLVRTEDNPMYRLNFADIARYAGSLISDDVCAALKSGKFEGEIMTEKCRLDPTRIKLVEDEALLEFAVHLEQWFKHHALKHLAELDDEEKDDKHIALGKQAMNQFEQMIKEPELGLLAEVIKNIRIGSIGKGHSGYDSKLPDSDLTGERAKNYRDNEGKLTVGAKASSNGLANNSGKSNDKPFLVKNPEVKRNRKMVRGHSTGISYGFEERLGGNLYSFNEKNGELIFNTVHPLWAKAETKNNVMINFQIYLTIQALSTQLVSTKDRDTLELYHEEANESYLCFIFSSESKKGRPKLLDKGKKFSLKSQ